MVLGRDIFLYLSVKQILNINMLRADKYKNMSLQVASLAFRHTFKLMYLQNIKTMKILYFHGKDDGCRFATIGNGYIINNSTNGSAIFLLLCITITSIMKPMARICNML